MPTKVLGTVTVPSGPAWRMRPMVDLSDAAFVGVILAASVVGATVGTLAVWAWDRTHG